MIVLTRCDDRLIHGQCVVRVINDFNIDYIAVVDTFTATNPVLKNIFAMAVPPKVKAEVFTVTDAKERLASFVDSKERVLLLMKSPEVALEIFKANPNIKKELNIGPMSNRKNTTKVSSYANLLNSEAAAIRELVEMEVRVYFNQVIDQKTIEWREVERLFK